MLQIICTTYRPARVRFLRLETAFQQVTYRFMDTPMPSPSVSHQYSRQQINNSYIVVLYVYFKKKKALSEITQECVVLFYL